MRQGASPASSFPNRSRAGRLTSNMQTPGVCDKIFLQLCCSQTLNLFYICAACMVMVYHAVGADQPSCCGAVPGTIPQTTAALLTAIGIRRTTRIITTVFGSSVFPPALFSARIGKWEFIERAEEESRSAPVMLTSCNVGNSIQKSK